VTTLRTRATKPTMKPSHPVSLVALSLLAAPIAAQQTTTPCPPPAIVATGVTAEPGDVAMTAEHYSVTAGMPLQGNAQAEKFAPVLTPFTGGNLANFQSVVVIDNPDPGLQLVVDLAFFTSAGIPAGTIAGLTIEPRGHRAIAVDPSLLTDNIGTVRVTATADSPNRLFVGATVHYANQSANPIDLVLPGPNPVQNLMRPMTCMQPLQELSGGATRASFGPIPVRRGSGIDSLNGLVSVLHLCNPSAVLHTITMVISRPIGPPILSTYTIPARGSIVVWDPLFYAAQQYLTTNPDHDIVVRLVSGNNLPILGEVLTFDLFESAAVGGPGKQPPLGTPFGRARVSSMMLGYSPTASLVNAEITNVASGLFQSTMGIANVGATDAGPVTIDYFDRLGNLIASDNLPLLPPLSTALFGPGLVQSPNFPTSAFRWSAQIRACGSPGLIGWANRASEAVVVVPEDDFQEMYGELLLGAGGREHATGFQTLGVNTVLAPIVLHDLENVLPSYVTCANHSVANIGPWVMWFRDPFGLATGAAPVGGSFAGMRWRATAFTNLENVITAAAPVGGGGSTGQRNQHKAFIYNTTGFVQGIQTIGGQLWPHLPIYEAPPVYPGPGDL